MRIEKDFLGEKVLPKDALYGIQTLRAKENFALGYKPTHHGLLRALILVKKAAALTYRDLASEEEEARLYQAVASACDRLLAGEEADMFILDALQGGAGTSTHMNVNEVIANLALRILGKEPGTYEVIHPLDTVNRGQSTNDVYPTALRIAAITLLRDLSGGCAQLQEALQKKEQELEGVQKLGRTELMDAVPVTLGAEFGAYAQAIARDRWRLYKIEERLRQINLGGTAVGLGSVAEEQRLRHRQYRFRVLETLRELTGMGLAAAEYPMDSTQNADVFVEVSGLLKALSVNLMKIAGDLRLMNSGPRGGLREIKLAPLQMGSTIMPGKVNPVMAEMMIQCAIRVQANDYAITAAASRGELELNAFLPLIADALLESLSLLNRGVGLFRTKCIEPLQADIQGCTAHLSASYAFATAWTPQLGYDTVSTLIAHGQDGPESLRKALEAKQQEQLRSKGT
ncbi:MAG: aspartate ammonia-lyase [Spirochaetaceae bacterium]|jgi:aspartate ammonia-lyase|nr:aspartate ammonia-lyase [Spirochaetaceae bacterium]